MKKSELKQLIKEEIISLLSEETFAGKASEVELTKNPKFSSLNAQAKSDSLIKLRAGGSVTLEEKDEEDVDVKDDWNKYEDDGSEEFDKEPTSKDLKKGDSITKIANKLSETTSEMKRLAKKWKDAQGAEKDKLFNRMKELTKIKKELEKLL